MASGVVELFFCIGNKNSSITYATRGLIRYFLVFCVSLQELQLHLGVLQQHAALIGGPNATSCPICHKLFLGADALMEHMKHSHKDPSNSTPPVAAAAAVATTASKDHSRILICCCKFVY